MGQGLEKRRHTAEKGGIIRKGTSHPGMGPVLSGAASILAQPGE
ncbi:hypothetical protein DESPIG_01599 [Desulfovibrio piger ATCC 29098]|uniref:Uncharacterized protein n=1 Tax=Desulfovibrio piger ATCC 29098 TaxID=411464 RepID=B6WU41_9BACT|nr:hypothetical protein DESPIG_01599 [Desulfovibrio piger ATCC 29098]